MKNRGSEFRIEKGSLQRQKVTHFTDTVRHCRQNCAGNPSRFSEAQFPRVEMHPLEASGPQLSRAKSNTRPNYGGKECLYETYTRSTT